MSNERFGWGRGARFIAVVAVAAITLAACARQGGAPAAAQPDAAPATAAGPAAPAIAADPAAENRRIVGEFARIFYEERDVRRAFEAYVVPDYVQHNPNIADGREAAIVALTPLFSDPKVQFKVHHVLVDGDMAVVHLFARPDAQARGAAVADFFRLANGKIVEHWDVLQDVPAKAANAHPMF
ncbi:MAG: nuclear transport factor 2 family protein [Steroidobacteraceae bacterium]